jgi:hypothetical protein
MNATVRKARPTYLRLVQLNEIDEPEPYFRLELEEGVDGEELALVTISRHARLLAEVRSRLGGRLSIRKIIPCELSFVVRGIDSRDATPSNLLLESRR